MSTILVCMLLHEHFGSLNYHLRVFEPGGESAGVCPIYNPYSPASINNADHIAQSLLQELGIMEDFTIYEVHDNPRFAYEIMNTSVGLWVRLTTASEVMRRTVSVKEEWAKSVVFVSFLN
jgi:hypothetical protein